MAKRRSWSDEELRIAVEDSRSIRQVLIKLNLVPAGGNYIHVSRQIQTLRLDNSHFTGKGWNVGLSFKPKKAVPLKMILVNGSLVQSYKLKRRLIATGLKQAQCEICGWSEKSLDGRIPIELHYINGDSHDNRLSNLQVLCPNCHSLQATHRGKNKMKIKN